MTSIASVDAKAASIPRYAEPTWDELREADFDEALHCVDCNWYIKCTEGQARTVIDKLSPYSVVGRSRHDQRAVRQAVLMCGICARHNELAAWDDCICDEFEERQ